MNVYRQLADLLTTTQDDIHRFSFKGFEAYAKVVSVYDGDTCDVVFYRRNEKVRLNCRLLGYDASELRDYPWKAKLARDYLAHICMGGRPNEFDDSTIWTKDNLQEELDNSKNLIYAVFDEFDDFGRALVKLKLSCKPGSRWINTMMRKYVETL